MRVAVFIVRTVDGVNVADMKIKVKEITEGCMPVRVNGDAFDLKAAKDITIKAPQSGVLHQEDNEKVRNVTFKNFTVIPLGIAMKLPEGFVADIKPRSSMTKKWYILQTNSPGLIDSNYCGDNDEWGLPVIAIGNSHIHAGDRVCQFEIRPSQFASLWQRLKWFFHRKIEFIKVDSLNSPDRKGFGSTGEN